MEFKFPSFVFTWMMLTDEFLSSGPTHCSIMTPWLSSPLSRPSKFSTDATLAPCPVDHPTSRTGHPPRDWRVCRRIMSPVALIWPLLVVYNGKKMKIFSKYLPNHHGYVTFELKRTESNMKFCFACNQKQRQKKNNTAYRLCVSLKGD